MNQEEATALSQALVIAHRHKISPNRLAFLLLDAQRIEQGEPSIERGRTRDPLWRSKTLAWLREQPGQQCSLRDYCAYAGVRRGTGYARLYAMHEDGLVAMVEPGIFRAI